MLVSSMEYQRLLNGLEAVFSLSLVLLPNNLWTKITCIYAISVQYVLTNEASCTFYTAERELIFYFFLPYKFYTVLFLISVEWNPKPISYCMFHWM